MPAKKTKAADEPAPIPGLWPVKPFIHCFAFLPNARRMLSGHALSNEILEWDLDTGEVVHTWRKGRKTREGVNAIAVDDQGERFIAVDQSGLAGSTNYIRVWPLDKANVKRSKK